MFNQSNIDNGGVISAKSVEEPKIVKNKKELLYRTLFCSPICLENFFRSGEDSQAFLTRILDLKFCDNSFSLYIPLLFFNNNSVQLISPGVLRLVSQPNFALITSAANTMSDSNIPKSESASGIATSVGVPPIIPLSQTLLFHLVRPFSHITPKYYGAA